MATFPLTLAEARAILIADDALALSFAAREAQGQLFGVEELAAWLALVESAKQRVVVRDEPALVTPYPGGNEPDFQTLFVEAVATARRSKS